MTHANRAGGGARVPLISVILPASNEAALIGGCLSALLASDWARPEAVQAIVVANGCQDDTAEVARNFAQGFATRGWSLEVIERAEGGKLAALNAGEDAAIAPLRAYLDADVTLSPPLLAQLAYALLSDRPVYASGQVRICASGWISRAYARMWARVPFMSAGVPGCGLFAVNGAGRARWQEFPDIISDDTFVRLSFAPHERVGVAASYDWPIAEGFDALVRVRRRQDAGVDEIAERYPNLLQNDDKAPYPWHRKLRHALRDPLGFAVYAGVAVAVKLTRHRAAGWSRGR
jgi:glycosyltransferase involved in cell wall biosynthesis